MVVVVVPNQKTLAQIADAVEMTETEVLDIITSASA